MDDYWALPFAVIVRAPEYKLDRLTSEAISIASPRDVQWEVINSYSAEFRFAEAGDANAFLTYCYLFAFEYEVKNDL